VNLKQYPVEITIEKLGMTWTSVIVLASEKWTLWNQLWNAQLGSDWARMDVQSKCRVTAQP
jgi:hypothetical protein